MKNDWDYENISILWLDYFTLIQQLSRQLAMYIAEN